MRTPSLPRRTVTRAGAAALALVLVTAVVVVAVVWWRDDDTRLTQAVRTAPASSQRVGFVDWAGVRASTGADEVEPLLDRAFPRDLSAPSALLSSAEGLQQQFGLSPATLEWEAFSQGEKGASLALKAPEDFDFDRLAQQLEQSGFTRPEQDAMDGGVWAGGPEVLARMEVDLSPELQYWALLREEGLVVTSDRKDWVPTAVAAARGEAEVEEPMRTAADASGDPLSSIVLRGDYTCENLAMSQADESDQQRGEQLAARAGEIDPVTAYALSLHGDRQARGVLTFEDAETARANADSRAALATGPAPGQGGSFSDRFRLEQTVAEDEVVRMSMRVRPGKFVLSDLSHGPVLFATC